MSEPKNTPEAAIIPFKSSKDFEKWLAKNYELQTGVWMLLYKKGSEIPTISYAEALDIALCYGWIDGQKKSYDEVSFLQKFTPRRARSIWSKRNTEHIARLTEAGKMQPSGLAEVEKAKADGRWEQAYDAPSEMKVPDDFLKELSKHKKAFAFFEGLNKTNKFAVAFRLHTAKRPETRAKRLKEFIDMLKEGKKLY